MGVPSSGGAMLPPDTSPTHFRLILGKVIFPRPSTRFWETYQFRTRFKASLGRSCRGSLPSAERIKAPRRSEQFHHQPTAKLAIIVAMKFTSTIVSFAALFSVALAVDVRYDTAYDNAQASLTTVACSDGTNGLLTKNFTTFGSLPSFPNIGCCPSSWGLELSSVWVVLEDIIRGEINQRHRRRSCRGRLQPLT
ncbi:hypothetical protein EDB84DRAFT_494826 [Lactarius hengduanensis]|nr:hypothetical protein EDB84DRAFT_494826 [Lactarius hengduanensis]